MRRTVLCILLLFGWVFQAQAEAYRDTVVRVNTVTIEDGLVQSNVNDILKDSYGIMWFATCGGLTRYDSEDFISYIYDPTDSTSLGDNYVNHLCEGANGDIWLATNKGLSVFMRGDLHFANYDIQTRSERSDRVNHTVHPLYDPRGIIWAMSGDNLIRFDIAKKSYEAIPFPERNRGRPALLFANNIALDANGLVWIVAQGMVAVYDPEARRYVEIGETGYNLGGERLSVISDLAAAKDGSLWFAEARRVLHIQRGGRAPQVYQLPKQGEDDLIFSLWLDYADRPYCMVNGEIGHPDLVTKRWTFVKSLYAGSDPLKLLHYDRGYFKDPDVYWIPYTAGVAEWRGEHSMFSCFDYYSDRRQFFPNLFVSSVYTQNDTTVWVGSWPYGLTRLNAISSETKTYDWDPSVQNDELKGVTCLRRLSDGRLVGASLRGFLEYDEALDRWQPSELGVRDPKVRQRIRQLGISCFLELPGDSLVLGTVDSLYFFNPKTERLRGFEDMGKLGVLTLTYDKRGYVWVGSWHGLQRITLADGSLKTFRSLAQMIGNGDRGDIPVLSVHVGIDGELWIGTNKGFYMLDAQMRDFSQVSKLRFFASNNIYTMQSDIRGNLWVGTDRGLAEYDVLDKSYRVYGKADGLPIREYNLNASYASENGVLYFGGVNGLVVHDPKASAGVGARNVHCIISQCLMSMRDTVVRVPLRLSNKITMPPGANSLTLFFSPLDYNQFESARYQVLIPEVSKKWENVYTRNSITITNLPEGRLTLKYRVSTSEGVWAEGTPYVLEVRKAFRQSRRYYLFVISLFGFVVFSVLALTIFYAMKTRRIADSEQEARKKAVESEELAMQREQKLTESLDYARRIQRATMPSMNALNAICPQNFLIDMPKDQLSGDSYYISRQGDIVYVALVDCTGHGVPGALISVIAQYHLRYIIQDLGTRSAARILSLLNDRVYGERDKKSSPYEMNDSMDLAVCVIDVNKQMIDFCGAKSDILFFSAAGLERIKGDNIMLGDEPGATFTSRRLHYSPTDTIYLHTDGYIDQLDGTASKKFGRKQFMELIHDAALSSLEEQKRMLLDTLEQWQNGFPQVDDISVLAIRCSFTKE